MATNATSSQLKCTLNRNTFVHFVFWAECWPEWGPGLAANNYPIVFFNSNSNLHLRTFFTLFIPFLTLFIPDCVPVRMHEKSRRPWTTSINIQREFGLNMADAIPLMLLQWGLFLFLNLPGALSSPILFYNDSYFTIVSLLRRKLTTVMLITQQETTYLLGK